MEDREKSQICLSSVNGMNRVTPFREGETVSDYLHIEKLKILRVDIYKRIPEDCPFARGNWMVDIFHLNPDMEIISLKFPLDEHIDNIHKYMKPMLDLLTEHRPHI